METIKILAVDDHKMTVMGYKYILEDAKFDGFKVEMDIATTFDLAKQKIEHSAKLMKYDILLLDIQLFSLDSGDTRTGEDLGVLARKIIRETRIVFMSSFSDSLRIQSIFKSVTPDGYMVKSEIDESTLIEMVNTVKMGILYYSPSALLAMRKTMSRQFTVDDNDKMILQELAKGTKTKDIANIVPLSQASIENRKRQLKLNFGIKDENDLALINIARNKGFL
ncbi:response regulator transcription factor [Aurantibacter crassamenti]|uniref:response regulator transcription factor n=1 Tax=Aurantibacter crassamenti TaxID=1837375 RepID=UPI0019397A58|nr:response regulator transcription factor [Aurantibacter crassamenti]MBM1107454.1 response regulator transcription factor [Aurantibacter crassamenti]